MKKISRDMLITSAKNRVLSILSETNDVKMPVPTEMDLSQKLDISRSTVHTIYQQLVQENILVSKGKRKHLGRKLKRTDFKVEGIDHTLESNRVEDEIMNLLTSGKLNQGEKFSESELARKLNCSTIPLREALIKLSQSGLIEKHPRKNWEVTKLTPSFVNDLYECREEIECKGAQVIIKLPKNHTVFNSLKTLKAQHKNEFGKKKISIKAVTKLDHELHNILFSFNTNFYYKQMAFSIKLAMKFQQQHNLISTRETHRITLKDHLKVINALLKQNQAESLNAIKSHLQASNSVFKNSVEENI